jgi:hypothetical protein
MSDHDKITQWLKGCEGRRKSRDIPAWAGTDLMKSNAALRRALEQFCPEVFEADRKPLRDIAKILEGK